MKDVKSWIINSPLGRYETDHLGSPIGVVRMESEKSYSGMGALLQVYINDSDQESWKKIKAKIDYTYENLDLALTPLEKETRFSRDIKIRVEKGQKLLFKVNLVNPLCIDPGNHGPDVGSTACTEWPFIAALMSWFHDRLGIAYHQMCLGEASTGMSAAAGFYSRIHPEGKWKGI